MFYSLPIGFVQMPKEELKNFDQILRMFEKLNTRQSVIEQKLDKCIDDLGEKIQLKPILSTNGIEKNIQSNVTSQLGTENISFGQSDDEPNNIIVVENGKKSKPMTKSDFLHYPQKPCDLIFNTIRNTLNFQHKDDRERTIIDLSKRRFGQSNIHQRNPNKKNSKNSLRACKQLTLLLIGRILEILRILAENPGDGFSEYVFGSYIGYIVERATWLKYIESLRKLLNDYSTKYPFLLTDSNVVRSTSKTGSAHYLDPAMTYRVRKLSSQMRQSLFEIKL